MIFFNLKRKLILRNVQPRTIMYVHILLVLMGISYVFFDRGIANMLPYIDLLKILTITVLIGGISSNFGRSNFSWDSSFIDLILTRNKNISKYLIENYYFMGFMNFILFCLLAIIFLFIDLYYIWVSFSILIFHIGITNSIYLYFSTFNGFYIELNKRDLFSVKGTNSKVILYGLIMLIPVIVFLIFIFLGVPTIAPYFVTIIGILGIGIYFYFTLNKVKKTFDSYKYKLREDLKETALIQ